jgi:hypothetical protein
MRSIAVIVGLGWGLGLSGCLFPESDPPEPDIAIVSPTNGYVVDHHDPIVMQVEVTGGATVAEIQLLVDGVADASIAITPRPEGQLCDPCSFRIVWPATNVGEGSHVVQVSALADGLGSPRDGDAIEMIFDDKPQIATISPAANADLLGVGMANIVLSVRERGQATATIAIDGVTQAPQTSDECRNIACTFEWAWDTTSAPAGAHELEFTVSDGQSHTVRDTRTVYVDDAVKITSLEVTGITEAPTMEIEVYLFDDMTNELLGCAGSAHGLVGVDLPDVRYSVDARLVSAAGTPLHGSDIADRTLRFEVWEDDDVPVCPTPISPAGNNLIGKSTGASYEAWKTRSTPAAFGMVVELGTLFGRPLEQ